MDSSNSSSSWDEVSTQPKGVILPVVVHTLSLSFLPVSYYSIYLIFSIFFCIPLQIQEDEKAPQQDASDAHWIWQQLAAIDSCIFPCCYESNTYATLQYNCKRVNQLIPAHKIFHLRSTSMKPELILDQETLNECSQWRKRFNNKIKFQP